MKSIFAARCSNSPPRSSHSSRSRTITSTGVLARTTARTRVGVLQRVAERATVTEHIRRLRAKLEVDPDHLVGLRRSAASGIASSRIDRDLRSLSGAMGEQVVELGQRVTRLKGFARKSQPSGFNSARMLRFAVPDTSSTGRSGRFDCNAVARSRPDISPITTSLTSNQMSLRTPRPPATLVRQKRLRQSVAIPLEDATHESTHFLVVVHDQNRGGAARPFGYRKLRSFVNFFGHRGK